MRICLQSEGWGSLRQRAGHSRGAPGSLSTSGIGRAQHTLDVLWSQVPLGLCICVSVNEISQVHLTCPEDPRRGSPRKRRGVEWVPSLRHQRQGKTSGGSQQSLLRRGGLGQPGGVVFCPASSIPSTPWPGHHTVPSVIKSAFNSLLHRYNG